MRPHLAMRSTMGLLLIVLTFGAPQLLLGQNAAAPAAADGKAAKKAPPEKIQLSFANAEINVIVKWLVEMTGKALIKHKSVAVKLNVMITRSFNFSAFLVPSKSPSASV